MTTQVGSQALHLPEGLFPRDMVEDLASFIPATTNWCIKYGDGRLIPMAGWLRVYHRRRAGAVRLRSRCGDAPRALAWVVGAVVVGRGQGAHTLHTRGVFVQVRGWPLDSGTCGLAVARGSLAGRVAVPGAAHSQQVGVVAAQRQVEANRILDCTDVQGESDGELVDHLCGVEAVGAEAGSAGQVVAIEVVSHGCSVKAGGRRG